LPLPQLEDVRDHLTELVATHRRWVTGAVAGGLACFGIAAFGIAPLAPDASRLPQRLIEHALELPDLSVQLETLAAHRLQLSRSDLTRIGDTADSVLRRLGVDDAEAAAFLRNDKLARRLVEGRAGKMVSAVARSDGRLVELVARFAADEQATSHFTRLTITRADDGWRARVEVAPLETSLKLASGTIRSSLFAATDESRIPDGIAVQLAEMFSGHIDFHRELRRGDTFAVVYEALSADGEAVTWAPVSGRVVAAEFVNGGQSHAAIWYRNAEGKGGYFDLDGRSTRGLFLASPLEFSRVTSGFAMRLHPTQQTWRRHLGVDYAAPSGTAVRAVGEGRVDFAGWQNGYGNVVKVDHGNERETTYAHLSRIDVRAGERIEQGERLGAVGATGWATGPHLHFEFRIGGEHQDPQRLARAAEPLKLDAAAAREFAAVARAAKAQLEAARSIDIGSAAE
jgi:murein DD-endopeptidase MepM/ murein hydrolase activator NlpD